jgi:hypothetical protein
VPHLATLLDEYRGTRPRPLSPESRRIYVSKVASFARRKRHADAQLFEHDQAADDCDQRVARNCTVTQV